MSIPVNKRLYHLNGLSTDTKPIPSDISTGSTFLETDTGTTYVFSRATGTWKPLEDETSGKAIDAVCIGIVSIDKIKTEGLVDTYAIKYTNGASTTFTVTNGTFIEPNTTQEEETLIPNKLYTLDIDTNTYNIHDLFNINSDVLEDGSLESAVIDHTKYWPRLTDGKFVLNVPEKSFSTVFEFVNTNEQGQDIWQAFVLDEENSFVRYVGHFEYVDDHNRDSSDYYFVAKPQTIKEVDTLEADLADTKALLEETRAELVVESQRAITKEDELQEAVDNLEFDKDRLFTELNQEVSRAVIVEQTIKADTDKAIDNLEQTKADRNNPLQTIVARKLVVDLHPDDTNKSSIEIVQRGADDVTIANIDTKQTEVSILKDLSVNVSGQNLEAANVNININGSETKTITGIKSIDAGAIETSSDTLEVSTLNTSVNTSTLEVNTNELNIEANNFGRVYTATDENDNNSLNIEADNDLNVNSESTINITARNSENNLSQINVNTEIYNSKIGAKSEQLGMSSKSIEISENIANLGNKSETIDGETVYRFEKQEPTQEANGDADVYTANIAISNGEAIATVNGDTTFSTDTLRIIAPVISTEGDITNTGSLTNTGNVEINNGTLEVEGKTTLENDLEVQQNTDLQGTLDVTGAADLKNTLDVAEKATFDKAVEIKGVTNSTGITNTGVIDNTGNITNTGNIGNTGNITNNGNLTNTGALAQHGTVTIDGGTNTPTTITSNAAITNIGAITNTGNITNTGTFDITGATNITGTLHTTDVATFDTNIIIKGSKITKQATGQNDKDYTLPSETGTLALVSQVNAAETAAKAYTDTKIGNLDVPVIGDGNHLVSTIREENGILTEVHGPEILGTINASTDIPTSNAVKTYADNINTDLQTQINNLKSVQNVVEVVEHYSELASKSAIYDENDCIQVIQDENAHNERPSEFAADERPSSIYRLKIVGGVKSWDYVGSYGGDSYTKAQSDTRFVNRNVQVNGHALTSNISISQSDVGLGNVDNKSAATLKSEFTGQIAANNTGFVIGNDVYVHTSNTNNPHAVTKAQVGLGNVANLAPADLPVSTAQQTALNGKVDKVANYGLSKNDFTDAYKNFLDNTPLSVGYDTTNKVLYKTTLNPGGNDNIVTAAKLRDDAGFITAFQLIPDDNHFVSEKLVKDSLDDLETYVDNSIETASEITDNDYNDIADAFQAALNPSVEE